MILNSGFTIEEIISEFKEQGVELEKVE